MYKQLLRPILFRLYQGDAERAHEATLALLTVVGRARVFANLARQWSARGETGTRTLFGVRFPNLLGLAAGMDKNGVALAAWAALGFGHVEIGTVTWQAQVGNPRPRLFRLPVQAALINRMGFNNQGASALATRLAAQPTPPIPIGISIGKSKHTPIDAATADYAESFRALFAYASYFAINFSSPNTPGLRELQDKTQLRGLLATLQEENKRQQAQGCQPKPLLVKIAPDLGDSVIGELLDVCVEQGICGLIATNTTTGRDGLAGVSPSVAGEIGGLSGRPLAKRALEVVRLVSRETGGNLPIIGVGGISGPDDAKRMLDAGASLLQIYSGLVYEGPGLVRRINRACLRHTHTDT